MIEIVEYRAEWPAEFARLAARLRGALGDRALRIDHIGSTSVPGLASKDRIDVMVTVADFAPETLERFAAVRYTQVSDVSWDHEPPGWTGRASEWEKRYFRAPEGERATNTHVRAAGRANQRYALLFRDYLRAHPAASAAYGELKRRLAPHFDDTGAYADVKDPACDLIMVAAEAWAAQTGWQPGPRDA